MLGRYIILSLFRFASNKYSNDSSSVGDVYMHLTNYSINKNSATYSQNEDSSSCQVKGQFHKNSEVVEFIAWDLLNFESDPGFVM